MSIIAEAERPPAMPPSTARLPIKRLMPIDLISGDSLANSLIDRPITFPLVLIISAGNAMKFPKGAFLKVLMNSGTLA